MRLFMGLEILIMNHFIYRELEQYGFCEMCIRDRCYLDSKETFRDTDIEGFWELELMLYSNTFNEPERFETERQSFLEQMCIRDRLL